MKNIIILLFITISTTFYCQPQPYRGTLKFKLYDPIEERMITGRDFIDGKIKVLSYGGNSILKYDTNTKYFQFNEMGYEEKFFFIVYKKDTISISYPSVFSLTVKSVINLEKKSYSFYNKFTYDVYHSLEENNSNCKEYFICQGGYANKNSSIS